MGMATISLTPISPKYDRTENDGLALNTPPRRAEKLRITKPRSPTTLGLLASSTTLPPSAVSSKANHHGASPGRVRVRVLGSGAEVGVRAVGQGQGCRSGSLRVTQGHRSSLHERACRCRLLRTDACADTCRPSVWESRCVAAELSLRRCPPKQNAREPAQTNTSLS